MLYATVLRSLSMQTLLYILISQKPLNLQHNNFIKCLFRIQYAENLFYHETRLQIDYYLSLMHNFSRLKCQSVSILLHCWFFLNRKLLFEFLCGLRRFQRICCEEFKKMFYSQSFTMRKEEKEEETSHP